MTSIQTLKEYRDHPGISQSQLKWILSGKQLTNKKPSLTQLLGSYLDCALLTPHLKNDLYWIVDMKRPTDKIVELCDSLYQWIKNDMRFEIYDLYFELQDHVYQIEQWIETVDYYSNRPKTRVEKFIKEAKDWWSVLIQKGEREIITTIEELETELMIINLQKDVRWDWISKGEFQKDFYWEEEGIYCKGLGDICLDDVYIDLKYTTCPNLNEWIKVCTNLNYPFQMAFYKSGLGFKEGFWLVVNKDWYELVEVSDLMYQIGKWGYDKKETIRIGKVETDKWNHTPGYIDGLNMLNEGALLTDFNQIYLKNL